MLEQILNNDENTNEDVRNSQVSMADANEASHDVDQYGYFVENGSTYNGWVINFYDVLWGHTNVLSSVKLMTQNLCHE